ncbi:MAG: hypothetical protein AAF802_07785 [Planctomycetota bacterium]
MKQLFAPSIVTNPQERPELLKRWRCGRIVVEAGTLKHVKLRRLTGSVSMAQVWWQSRYGRPDDELCWLDYHQPIGMPAFLTLDYIRSGRKAGYRSFLAACCVLDEIAKIRETQAIVAHVSTASLSDRLLLRLGWERHLAHWSGRHWIRRFYDGYPDSRIERYLPAGL